MIITNYIFHYNEFNKDYVNNLNPEDNNIKKYIFFTLFSFMPFSITYQNTLLDIINPYPLTKQQW